MKNQMFFLASGHLKKNLHYLGRFFCVVLCLIIFVAFSYSVAYADGGDEEALSDIPPNPNETISSDGVESDECNIALEECSAEGAWFNEVLDIVFEDSNSIDLFPEDQILPQAENDDSFGESIEDAVSEEFVAEEPEDQVGCSLDEGCGTDESLLEDAIEVSNAVAVTDEPDELQCSGRDTNCNQDDGIGAVVSNGESNPSEDENPDGVESIFPDPYFFVDGVKFSFLPMGASCGGAANCAISSTPIQDALNVVSAGLKPDDGIIYIEGGDYAEDVLLQNISSLTLQGMANNGITRLFGAVNILNSDNIWFKDFVFENTVTISNSANISLSASPLSDTVEISLVGNENQNVNVDAGAGNDTIRVKAHTESGQIFLNGGAGDDTLIVDFDALYAYESLLVTYDGGEDYDVLEISGGSFESIAYLPSGPNSGSIQLDGVEFSYTNIEPITDLVVASSVSYSGTSANDTISIVDGGSITNATTCLNGCDLIEIQSPQFENISFANKTSVTIDGSAGADQITLNITSSLTNKN